MERCRAAGRCGGCQYQGVPYEEQLALKQKKMEALLGDFGPVLPIIGMKAPEGYRCKVHHALAKGPKGSIISGSYEENSHKVVGSADCMLEDRRSREIIESAVGLAGDFKLQAYDEDRGTGLLRHILIRKGRFSGQIMVVIVTSGPVFPSRNNYVKALLKACPDITTVVQNINGKRTGMVLGERSQTLYGPGFIRDSLMGLSFRISASSFYQVNPIQAEALYRETVEFAGFTGNETVLDAYCGTGTIGLCAAQKAGRVIGVELNPNAVKDAVSNAKYNGIKNARFYKDDASRFIRSMAEKGEKADVIILDPPRSGSTEEFIWSAAKLSPSRIVYVSCGPDTLARDLKSFVKKGYEVEKIRPIDMFPFTDHVETVVLLSKGEIDSKKVRVEFSLEDMDMSDFQDKATYTQIKDYVLEHSGLKVSNLYISQIKRKCGLEVGKNYNLPKAEDSRQPQCPSEKENAIREAMKYFGMI
ncbi:MAG: 23S rRNA (uracil(1939)-C(5))-methyltransferase RlmD [Firmicutes bacterium]|nr:23S rRNA (uracil(1939)-C(5))-methyltransferase RlmD [Bacillota bacterium]